MPEQSDEELTALESALRELRPQPEPIPRDVLMYRAGRASVRGWVWPAATLVSTAAALVLGMILWLRPAPATVYVTVPQPRNEVDAASTPTQPLEDDTEPGGWSRYADLQEQVFYYGLDGLPAPPSATDEAAPDAKSLLNSL